MYTVSVGFDGENCKTTAGQLNVCYNCVDRHIPLKGDQVAIIHEGDEPGHARSYTYKQLLAEVCRVANVMLAHGVKKGDTVAMYVPVHLLLSSKASVSAAGPKVSAYLTTKLLLNL